MYELRITNGSHYGGTCMDFNLITRSITIVKINSSLSVIPCTYIHAVSKCSQQSCSCTLAFGLVNFFLVSVSTVVILLTYIAT